MELPWLELFVFPGFLFVLAITIAFEHINSRLDAKLQFGKSAPMFIPIVNHFKLWYQGESEKFDIRAIVQGIVLIGMFSLPLIGALALPINLYGSLPGIFGGNGVVGVISFEGDIILILGVLILFGVAIFLVQWLEGKNTNFENMKMTISFMSFDIPLFISFAGPAITRKTLCLSLLAEDIRLIVYSHRAFGFVLIPLGLLVALACLTMKFDQPYLNKLDGLPEIGRYPPTKRNWKYSFWHLSMRLMETVIAGTIVSIFLAGAYLPIPILKDFEVLAFTLNFTVKCMIVLLIITIVKAFIPRLRMDQSMNLCWKLLTPISLLSVILIGGGITTFNLVS